uniref:chitinase n=1 Tax=Grandidierella japonica TaxID=429032 RepID=A0A4D6YS27_GRAJA|nr:chitinase [Grandidierella japonica]
MPLYGQSFSLSQASDNTLNQKTYGGGQAGPYTRARGFLAYYEICYFIKNQGWTVVKDKYKTMGPYAYKGNQWVSFDDMDVIRYKSEYAKELGLGGGMIWALDLDDFKDRCGCGKYPLLKTINRVLRGYSSNDPSCPVLGGGSPTELLPYTNKPYEQITTTTTLEPWKRTTSWQRPTTTTTRRTTRMTTPRTTTTTTTTTSRPPWLPPVVTDRPSSVVTKDDGLQGSRCETGEYRHHPSDCSKFYQCNHGKLVERSCLHGLHWGGSYCMSASQSNCQSSPSAPVPAGPTKVSPEVIQPPPITDTMVKPPVIQSPAGPSSSEYMVVCYFTNWAWYRQGVGKYTPDDIDADLCTHVVYGFAVLDSSKYLIKPHDTWADFDNKFYEKVTALKARGVKVLIAIGGWNDSAGSKYSDLVNDPNKRKEFNKHALEFVENNNFDGLDLDWEYPKCWQVDCKKGPDTDKQAFTDWVMELASVFHPRGLLVTAAVSPNYKVIDAGYDVAKVSRYLDWVAVMTYDYHGQWDKKTGHVAPMYHYKDSEVMEFNANYTIHYWIEKGADRKKLVMGMPMYGQSFRLSRASDNGYNAKSSGKGQAGQYTRAGGFLAYYEICKKIQDGGYTVVRDPDGAIGPYAYKGSQWFGYDDIAMIRYKSEYVKRMGLGGAMIWALDLDDFRNRCGCEEHPLLRTINRVLRGYPIPDPGCTI